MDIHPWTKYEIARARDEARLLRARDAMRASELRRPGRDDVGIEEVTGSWLDRLLRRPVADQASVKARPV
jgi:hypothetical protein